MVQRRMLIVLLLVFSAFLRGFCLYNFSNHFCKWRFYQDLLMMQALLTRDYVFWLYTGDRADWQMHLFKTFVITAFENLLMNPVQELLTSTYAFEPKSTFDSFFTTQILLPGCFYPENRTSEPFMLTFLLNRIFAYKQDCTWSAPLLRWCFCDAAFNIILLDINRLLRISFVARSFADRLLYIDLLIWLLFAFCGMALLYEGFYAFANSTFGGEAAFKYNGYAFGCVLLM